MKYWLLLVGLVCTSMALAGGTGTGKVYLTNVTNSQGKGLVTFSTEVKMWTPECNVGDKRFVIDLDSPAGKEQYSLLLAAQLADRDVFVRGASHCYDGGTVEVVLFVGFPQ